MPESRVPGGSPPLPRRLLAEFLGSALLAAIVIGSGIAAQQLSPGNVGLQLFDNAAATATGLFAIILMFGPVSGAHFNPAVSLVDASFGGMSWRDIAAYIPAQATGCITAPGSRPRSSARSTLTSPPPRPPTSSSPNTDEPHRSAHERRPGDHAIEPA